MRRPLKISIIIFFLLIITRCYDRNEQLYEPQLNIYCLLAAHYGNPSVLVDRTYLMDEKSSDYIDDALVILAGCNQEDTLIFSDTSYMGYIYITPESLYTLTIIHPDFDTLIGKTRIPGDFQIIYPVFGDTFKSTDTIIATKSSGAPYYLGYFIDPNGYQVPFWHTPDTTDTLIRITLPIQIQTLPPKDYTILLMACDENYQLYSNFDPRQDSILKAGVEGGIGVFGSYNKRRVNVHFSH